MTFDILGKKVIAITDQELVEAIQRAWTPTANVEGAMKTISQQAYSTRNIEVRTDSVNNFLFDLQIFGLLRIVDDPWPMFGLDRIKLALFGPMAPTGWRHEFIWSNQVPHIASISDNGTSVVHPIHMSELPEPNYQEQWLNKHLYNLRH